MSNVPSPAELAWRIGWLAGTAVPPPPEPAPEPEPAWLQAPTTAEIEPAPRRGRSLLRESIRLELDRQAQRVYVAAQREVERQARPRSTLERYWLESAGTEDLMLPSRYVGAARATPVRKRFGFYEIETSLPVEGTWITTELVQPPLVWGRRWAQSKARRILAQHARGEL